MFQIIIPRFSKITRTIVNESIKRHFLSNAYKCDDVWRQRLQNPAFKKIDLGSLYHDLDLTFQDQKPINVLDIDLLLNGIADASYRNELDDVLLKVRLNPECRVLPERSTHAAIRFYIDNASTEDILNVLSDRMNYGLFPDYYLTNLLLNKYLTENDVVAAVKIAVLQMLQEDFDNPIMKSLAIHSCFKYLNSNEIWPSYQEPEPDPDEDVVKVRVDFVRNPYFDDHFDLTNTNHLVGKTLWLFGRTVNDTIGTSSQLVGLVLYEKHQKAAEFLEEVLKNNKKIHKDAIDKAKEYCIKTPKQAQGDEGSEETPLQTNEDKSENVKEDSKEVESNLVDEWKAKVLKLLDNIKKEQLVDGNLVSISTDFIKITVKENEKEDIRHQTEVYKLWEKEREDHIKSEIEKETLRNIKSEIDRTKAELQSEEEKLFFFEREDELILQAKKKEEEMKKVRYMKAKGTMSRKVEDNYVPPTIGRKNQ